MEGLKVGQLEVSYVDEEWPNPFQYFNQFYDKMRLANERDIFILFYLEFTDHLLIHPRKEYAMDLFGKQQDFQLRDFLPADIATISAKVKRYHKDMAWDNSSFFSRIATMNLYYFVNWSSKFIFDDYDKRYCFYNPNLDLQQLLGQETLHFYTILTLIHAKILVCCCRFYQRTQNAFARALERYKIDFDNDPNYKELGFEKIMQNLLSHLHFYLGPEADLNTLYHELFNLQLDQLHYDPFSKSIIQYAAGSILRQQTYEYAQAKIFTYLYEYKLDLFIMYNVSRKIADFIQEFFFLSGYYNLTIVENAKAKLFSISLFNTDKLEHLSNHVFDTRNFVLYFKRKDKGRSYNLKLTVLDYEYAYDVEETLTQRVLLFRDYVDHRMTILSLKGSIYDLIYNKKLYDKLKMVYKSGLMNQEKWEVYNMAEYSKHNVTRPLLSSNASYQLRYSKSSLFHGLMTNWNIKATGVVESKVANNFIYYHLHKMIADSKRERIALQNEAVKEIRNNMGNQSASSGKTRSKPKPTLAPSGSKEVQETLPLKHQSKTVATKPSNSKLDQFASKNPIGGNFQSKLDKFSKDDLEKNEEKEIIDNLERNYTSLTGNETQPFPSSSKDGSFQALGKAKFKSSSNYNQDNNLNDLSRYSSYDNNAMPNRNNPVGSRLFNRDATDHNNSYTPVNPVQEEDLIDFGDANDQPTESYQDYDQQPTQDLLNQNYTDEIDDLLMEDYTVHNQQQQNNYTNYTYSDPNDLLSFDDPNQPLQIEYQPQTYQENYSEQSSNQSDNEHNNLEYENNSQQYSSNINSNSYNQNYNQNYSQNQNYNQDNVYSNPASQNYGQNNNYPNQSSSLQYNQQNIVSNSSLFDPQVEYTQKPAQQQKSRLFSKDVNFEDEQPINYNKNIPNYKLQNENNNFIGKFNQPQEFRNPNSNMNKESKNDNNSSNNKFKYADNTTEKKDFVPLGKKRY